MMKRLARVVVDSGGTKTSWGFLFTDGSKEVIDTESFHPYNFNADFFERNKSFLNAYVTEKVPLYFFGAGMGNNEYKQLLTDFFHPYFSEIVILTDIQGLVLSLEMENGTIAIMGTGSVLVEVYNQTIRQQIGGLGYQVGDEGSAFYFGKLVLQAYFSKELNSTQVQELEKVMVHTDETLENLLSKKYEVASLAKLLTQSTFSEFHQKNVSLFFEIHVDGKVEVSRAAFIGSYAYFERELISEELAKRAIKDIQFIQQPIQLFCDKFAIK